MNRTVKNFSRQIFRIERSRKIEYFYYLTVKVESTKFDKFLDPYILVKILRKKKKRSRLKEVRKPSIQCKLQLVTKFEVLELEI